MTDQAGPRLYDRRFSIVVYDASGKGLDLSSLRCRFTVRQWETSTPNTLDLVVTNLSASTASRIMKEFTRVQISAGYEGLYGIIFDGTIVQARQGRDSPTDTFCGIVATDGDRAHNQAIVSTTLAAGSTPADVHRACLTAFSQYGVSEGYTDPVLAAGPALPRGKVMFGMARDHMRDLCRTTDTNWSFQNGRLQVVSRGDYLPNEAVVITAKTGMIGLPTIEPDGISVRCLLNPLLKISSRIKLDNASIQRPRIGTQLEGGAGVGIDGKPYLGRDASLLPQIAGDGIYVILAINHQGDTRGNEWYSDMSCIAPGQGATVASIPKGRVAPTAPVSPLTSQPVAVAASTPTDNTASPATASAPIAPLPTQPSPAPLYVDPTTGSRGF